MIIQYARLFAMLLRLMAWCVVTTSTKLTLGARSIPSFWRRKRSFLSRCSMMNSNKQGWLMKKKLKISKEILNKSSKSTKLIPYNNLRLVNWRANQLTYLISKVSQKGGRKVKWAALWWTRMKIVKWSQIYQIIAKKTKDSHIMSKLLLLFEIILARRKKQIFQTCKNRVRDKVTKRVMRIITNNSMSKYVKNYSSF